MDSEELWWWGYNARTRWHPVSIYWFSSCLPDISIH
jgi:hypothetical protein